jgi:hypothetical protein
MSLGSDPVARIGTVALTITKFSLGVLALALLRWTPTTGKGILIYVSLLAVLIALVIVLSKRKGEEG